jgi:hypothetical protein
VIAMKTLRNAMTCAALGLVTILGSSCTNSTSSSQPIHGDAIGFQYTNPTATDGYRLVSDGSSRASYLSFDLIGPSGGSIKGVGFTLSMDSSKANWIKVLGGDFVLNRAFNVDPPPSLMKATPQGDQLLVGVFQTQGNAVNSGQVLLQVAMEYRVDASRPVGTPIALSVVPGSAKALSSSGSVVDINIAVGDLVAQ